MNYTFSLLYEFLIILNKLSKKYFLIVCKKKNIVFSQLTKKALFFEFQISLVSIPEQITPRNRSKGNRRTGQRETVLSND